MDPQPVTLEGTLVRLEPMTVAHAPDLFAALALDTSIWQWLPDAPPRSVVEMTAKINVDLGAQTRGERILFAQIDRKAGKVVGGTSYLNISRRDRGLEIGSTWLGKPWQRGGINTEAKYLLLRHAFETLGAVRVQLKTDRRNLQSQRAIERLGALREGILRKHLVVRDGFLRDSVLYSVIDDEWPAVKSRLERFLLREATGAETAGSRVIIHRRSGSAERTEPLGVYQLEALLDRAEEAAGTAYRVRIEPTRRTAVSYHRIAEEYYYVLAGSGIAFLDGKEYPLAPGDFVRLPPGVRHGFVAGDKGLEMLDVHTPGCRLDRDTYFVDDAGTEG